VTYLDKAGRQDMEQESSDKLLGRHGHDLFLIAIGVVTPAEGNLTLFQLEDTLIADGYPVGIAAEILKDSLNPSERGLAIDDPRFLIELLSEQLEGLGLPEMFHTVIEGEFSGFIVFLEIIQKLVSEQLGHKPDGEEESFSARDPAVFSRGQSAAGNNTVNMRMVHEVLSPGVDNSQEADACAETLGVLGEFPERLGD